MKMYGQDKLLPNKKSKKTLHIASICVLCTVVLAIVSLGVYYLVEIFNFFDSVEAPEIVTVSQVQEPDADEGALSIAEKNRKEDLYNILVVGTDLGGYHTDSIMLVSFDAKNAKMNVLSIPRDIICEGRSGQYYKINSAYRGSEENLENFYDEIERVVGFRPDKYVIVSTQGFVEMIDAIGGVEVDVPQNMKYSDPTQDLYIDIKKGRQVLDGYDSMCFMRFRRYLRGDVDRVEAQQMFLKALMDKMLTPSTLAKLPELVDIVEENVSTDLTVGNMIWLGTKVLDMDLKTGLATYTVPGEGLYYEGVSYFFVYPNRSKQLINDVFNPYTTPIKDFDVVDYTRLTGKSFGGE